MKMRFPSCTCWILGWLGLLGLFGVADSRIAYSKDYFLVVGGGYSPESNQASLEANFIFFQDILEQLNKAYEPQFYFFADGDDSKEDLQVTAPKPQAEYDLLKLMRGIHCQETEEVIYRNHQVPRVEGVNTPTNMKNVSITLRQRRPPVIVQSFTSCTWWFRPSQTSTKVRLWMGSATTTGFARRRKIESSYRNRRGWSK
jgi:hypothetical protein